MALIDLVQQLVTDGFPMNTRTITQLIQGMPASDGAGVRLSRIIGQPALDMLDPFLMLDEFGSDQPGDYIAGFPEHPHRGFETVTYMLDGRMRHGDNQGNSGLLTAGSAQWMTAGRGILHSEMPEQEAGLMRGFQLWVNLPARDKMCAPRYQDIPPERIPEVRPADGVSVHIVAGTLEGIDGPVSGVVTQPIFWDISLQPGATISLPLPATHNAFAYVFEGGAVELGGQPLDHKELAVLSAGETVSLQAGAQPARLLLVAGLPIGEPVARHGPFVMNSREDIIQAVQDLQAGRF